MAAEHAQLLASLAVGQLRPEQLADTVAISSGGITVEEFHTQEEPKEENFRPENVADESQGNVPTVIYGNLRKKRKVLAEDSPVYKVMPAKERSSTTSKVEMRRPVRPIDRQKMRPWLKNLLDKGSVFGLNWMKREEGVFQISWRHASRLGWNLETDGDVFERWARHTGIFKDGDTPEPKRWKANFRCALHSLPDVKELTSPDDRKGRNASRTYRFLTQDEVQPPLKRKHRYTVQTSAFSYQYDHPNSEDSGSQHSDDRNSDEEVSDGQPRQVPHCDHDYAARIDKVEGELTSAIFQRHGSGYVLIKSKDAHEYEFRLTSLGENSQETKQPKSPQKKSPAKRRKAPAPRSSPTAFNPSKRGKGKDSARGIAPQKGGKKNAKKRKKSGDKGTLPGGKPPTVTLQALLAGRQVNRPSTSKRPRTSRSPSASAKKAKSGKASGPAGKGAKGAGDSGSGICTPTQRQGLDACMLLLEAATQLDRMDSISSSDTSVTMCKPASSAHTPPKTAAQKTQAKGVTTVSSPNTSAVKSPPESMATVFVPSVTSASAGTLGAVFSVHQGNPGLLHQYLGLTAVTTASKTPALSSLLSVATHASTVGVPATPLLAAPFKVVGFINSIDPGIGTVAPNVEAIQKETPEAVSSTPSVTAPVQPPTSVPPIFGQPGSSLGAGTSMLKHLLRLTCPPPPRAMPVALTTTVTPSSAKHAVSVNLLPCTPHVASDTDEGSAAIAAIVKDERVTPPNEETDAQNKQNSSDGVVVEYELGASQEGTWEEKGVNNFPYMRVSTSKVFVKQEPQSNDSCSSEAVGHGSQTEVAFPASGGCNQQMASVDSIMQFLSLCAASGNSQVVFKSGTPVQRIPDDVIAINSAYSSVQTDPQEPAHQSNCLEPLNQISVFVTPTLGGEGDATLQHQLPSIKTENPEKTPESVTGEADYIESQDDRQEESITGIGEDSPDSVMPVLAREEPVTHCLPQDLL